MRRITLPGNHWADLREPSTHPDDMAEQITVKGRRGVQVALVGLSKSTSSSLEALSKIEDPAAQATAMTDLMAGLPEGDVDAMMRSNEAMVAALVTGWDVPGPDGHVLPLPTASSVGDLPVPVYDALNEAVVAETAAAVTTLSLDTSPSAVPDPKEPTGPSDSSAGA